MTYKEIGWLAFANLWRARFAQSQGIVGRKYIHVATCPADIGSGEKRLSADPVALAKASVQEIRKLLLGCENDRKGWLDCNDSRAAGSAMILSEARFDDFNLSPMTLKSLHEVLGYAKLTPVQKATLSLILQGSDVVVKSKFGTGKTLAFLLPAIEAVLETLPGNQKGINDVISLIICPTRELALQIFTQARMLIQFHDNIELKLMTGGFRISKERGALQASKFQIIVATPGRLLDHLQKTDGFKGRLENLKLLVVDEADHILDTGYRMYIEGILKHLPSLRQTLLFSATMSKEMKIVADLALKDGYKFINVDLIGFEQHEKAELKPKVKQKCIIAPVDNHLTLLYSTMKEHSTLNSKYKVLVFCVTARITAFMYTLFKELGFTCMEIHSKKSQMHRFHTYKDFRDSDGCIVMFTSDVSSRGLDYPNVTLIIQVGLSDLPGTYVSRIGRTGRCGNIGESLLLLTPWEEVFLKELQDQSIECLPWMQIDDMAKEKVISTIATIDEMVRWHAYRTWLGYYTSLTNLPLTKENIVSHANEFSASLGFDEPPVLPRSIISKMGLRGIHGLTKKRRSRLKED